MNATKRVLAILLLISLMSPIYADGTNKGQQPIEGLTFENFPRMDGSTSTKSLNALIFCKLLNVEYLWSHTPSEESLVYVDVVKNPEAAFIFGERVKSSKTHGAFLNLVRGNTDLILVQNTMSEDIKAAADYYNISLIETPVALDAFIFLVNKDNPVRDLTVDQIQRIYTGELTNWKEAGGNDTIIKPYVRPRNSGSQETMQSLVMGGLEMAEFPTNSEIATMGEVFPEMREYANAICYTFNYYKSSMMLIDEGDVPKIAINGVYPNEENIKNETYPFTSKVYAVIRSDIDKNSMAYKVYEWLQTGDANDMIAECGFVALDGVDDANAEISQNELHVFPNPTSDGFYINGLDRPAQLAVFDFSGRQLLSKEITDGEFVDIAHLSKGVYLIKVNDSIAKVIKK